MSGRAAVQSFREAEVSPARVLTPRWLIVVGQAAAVSCVAALAFVGVWYGVKFLPKLLPTATPVVATELVDTRAVAFSDQEQRACDWAFDQGQKADRARSHRNTRISALGFGQFTEGMAGTAGRIKCMVRTRPQHLCVERDQKLLMSAVESFLIEYGASQRLTGLSDAEFNTYFKQLRGENNLSRDYVLGGLAEVAARATRIHDEVAEVVRGAVVAGFVNPEAIAFSRGSANANKAVLGFFGTARAPASAC